MTNEEVQAVIDRCTKVVQTWPLWKQNILVHSGQAFGPRREPVVYEEEATSEAGDS